MRSPHKIGTPEAHLVCPKGEIDTDAIYSALFRAQAVIELLQFKFDGQGESQVDNISMICTLDSLAGYLDQINILLSEA